MDFLISFLTIIYFICNICGVGFLIPGMFDKIVETRVIKVHQIVLAIVLLPATILVLVVVLIYEIFKRLGSKKLYSKTMKLMNKKVIDFNKRK